MWQLALIIKEDQLTEIYLYSVKPGTLSGYIWHDQIFESFYKGQHNVDNPSLKLFPGDFRLCHISIAISPWLYLYYDQFLHCDTALFKNLSCGETGDVNYFCTFLWMLTHLKFSEKECFSYHFRSGPASMIKLTIYLVTKEESRPRCFYFDILNFHTIPFIYIYPTLFSPLHWPFWFPR